MVNEQLVETMQILGAYVIMMSAFVIAMNWLMRGFMWQFIRVRASRGRLTMLKIHAVNEIYFKAGRFEGQDLKYKNREGDECIFAGLPADSVHRMMGVDFVEIDEVNKCIWDRKGAVMQGNDPVHVDRLIKRAIESPELKNKVLKVIVGLLVFLLIVALIDSVLIYKVLQFMAKTTLATVIQ